MTAGLAGSIWSVLVTIAGAREDDRGAFVAYFTAGDHFKEWRFCGSLGFGGKVKYHATTCNPPRVDCYREDETPDRLATIKRCNEMIAAICGVPR